jgi:hypothetical protein
MHDTSLMTQADVPQSPPHQSPAVAAAPPDKSVAAALVLTFLFGPLGLFYTSVMGGVVMSLIGIVVAIFTLGIGLFLIWPIVMVWSAVVAGQQHQRFEEWRVRSMTGRG